MLSLTGRDMGQCCWINNPNFSQSWYLYRGQPGVRTEKLPDVWFEYNSAFSTVTEFYSEEHTSIPTPTPTSSTSTPSSSSSMDTQSTLDQDHKDEVTAMEHRAEGVYMK